MTWTPNGARLKSPLPGFGRYVRDVKGLEWSEGDFATNATLSMHPLVIDCVAGVMSRETESVELHAACVLPLHEPFKLSLYPATPWWNPDVAVLLGLVKRHRTKVFELDQSFVLKGAPAAMVIETARAARLERLAKTQYFRITLNVSALRDRLHLVHLAAEFLPASR